MIRCEDCSGDFSEIICNSWYEFFEHCYTAHPINRQHIRQIPFNISGRTKSQIVEAAENLYLQPYIV